MRDRWSGGLTAALVLATAMGAGAQEADTGLKISGSSTIRSWECEATSFEVAPTPTYGFEKGVLRGEKSLETVTLVFPVEAILCGSGTMEGHLRDALTAEKHPEVRYEMSRYELAPTAEGVAVAAGGRLTISGTTKPVDMNVTVTPMADGTIRVRGEQEINMKDFGVKPPTLMFGTLKVGEVVQVTFDVALTKQGAAVVANNPDGNR